MTENTTQPEQPRAAVHRQPAVLQVSVDKIDEIVAYIAAARIPQQYDTSVPFTIIPQNMKVQDLENNLPVPSRIRKSPKFIDVDSFVTYVNDFKVGFEPRVFSLLTKDGLSVKCAFDYDEAGRIGTADENSSTQPRPALPRWTSHTAQMDMMFHRDYAALRNNADKWHDQEDFALFIEENVHLFLSPSGAEMLELAQELRGNVSANWARGKRLSNGQTTLRWEESVTATNKTGEITVPDNIELNCPLFEGMTAQRFKAAFRWRLNEDKEISFSYRLQTKLIEREAQDKLKSDIETKTSLKLLNVSTFPV